MKRENGGGVDKRIIIATVAVLLAALVMAAAYTLLAPKGLSGAKRLTIEIAGAGGAGRVVSLNTESEFLRGALDEQKLIAGDEYEFGLFVKTVDGYTADESKQEWWCVTKNGETLMTGVDATPIADGERYELTLKTGY